MKSNKKKQNKKEQETLSEESNRLVLKALRRMIKDPSKLCDCCMNEWSNFTLLEEKLCDECYKEKYLKNS